MKQLFVISIVLFAVISCADCQSFRTDTDITWSNSRRLIWKDFLGKVEDNSFGIALCTSSIICKPYFTTDSVMLWIEAIFIPEKSWKKRTDLDSFDLAHEQTHFNITELFARKLRLIIADKIKSSKKGYATEVLFKIDSAFKELSIECNEMRNLYDKQTNHSINKDEQIKWNSTIWESLQKLDNWTFSSFFIGNIIVYKE